MNWLDLAIIGFVALSVIRGAMRGAIRSVLGLGAVLIALAVAGRTYPLLSTEIRDATPFSHATSDWIGFLVIYGVLHALLSVVAAISGLAGRVMDSGGVASRLAGAILDGYRAVVLCALLVGALLTAPQGIRLRAHPGPAAAQVLRIAAPMLQQLVPLFPGTAGEVVRTPSPPDTRPREG